MKDREIELKFLINEKIKKSIISDLEPIVISKFENKLKDTYYIPNFKSFENNGETVECVRIRESGNSAVLAYKKVHKVCKPVYCDEYESEIASKEQVEKILFSIGFETYMIIDKVRTTYKTTQFEFDFDSVKGLGELLEVELKSDSGSVDDIYNFVSKYGLDKKDVHYEGIQAMMKKAKKI